MDNKKTKSNKLYTKNVWLTPATATLLLRCKYIYMTDKQLVKCSDDLIIKEALGAYLYGKQPANQ